MTALLQRDTDAQAAPRQEITRALAEFAARTTFEDLPSEVVTGSKRSILDTVGIMLGGCAEPAPRIAAAYAAYHRASGAASIVGQGSRAPAPLAALVNGTAADVFGFSDISVENMTHPSGSIVAGVLAVAEEVNSSGRDIILAHVLGVEIANKIGVGVKPGLQLKGWHPLAVLNTFGVAVACGKLLGFNAEQMANALGIAGVVTGGIRAGMGTMSKAFGAGRAARDGVEAALLTHRGFTGPTEVIETRDGFLETFGDGVSGEGILDHLGSPYEYVEPGMTYKAYPTCTRSHPGITAALKLRLEHGIDPDAIDNILCNVSPAVADILKFGVPNSKLQAKYSLPFCVSLALIDGRVTLANVTDEKVSDPKMLELMKKVRMVVSPDFAQHGYLPPHAPHGARIHIRMKSGEEFVRQENRGPWEAKTPPSWEALFEKFQGCATDVLPSGPIKEAADIIHDLETAAGIEALMTIVRAEGAKV